MGDNCLGDISLLEGDPGLLGEHNSAFISRGPNGLLGNVILLAKSVDLFGNSLWLEGEPGLLAGDPALPAGERAFPPPGDTHFPTGDRDLVLEGDWTLREGESVLVLGDTGLLGGERTLFGVGVGGVRPWGEPGVVATKVLSSSKAGASTSLLRLGDTTKST